ncbi:unnamed protein product, partial [Staurois parvus]
NLQLITECTQTRVVRAGEVEWSGRPGQEPLSRQGTKEQADRSQMGRVRDNQADKVPEEQAGEWSGIAGVSNVRGSEVPKEQAENSQGHKPGSGTHGQRGTEGSGRR